MTPKRIQRKRTRGWKMPEGAIYVGRPSRLGNHFEVKQLIDHWIVIHDNKAIYESESKRNAAQFAVDRFREWVNSLGGQDLADYLVWLDGHDLACWCALDMPCHADVWLELANKEATR